MTPHVEFADQHQRDIRPIAGSRIVDTVVKQCGGRLPVETAERLVAEELRRFSDAPVQAFVEILVVRAVHRRVERQLSCRA